MAGQGDSIRAILFALGANFTIFVTKGVAAFITGSGAMLAETVHSLADCGNQLLLLLGLRQARTPPSPDYPLGYGKAIYFWSFLVAVMLFSVGGMFSVYEGVHKLQHPEPLKQWWWAVGVLVVSIAAEAVSMRACLVEVNKARGSRSLARWFRESRQAELVVIFGEDLAALFGLIFALVAIVARRHHRQSRVGCDRHARDRRPAHRRRRVRRDRSQGDADRSERRPGSQRGS